jgi:hypothetical protein
MVWPVDHLALWMGLASQYQTGAVWHCKQYLAFWAVRAVMEYLPAPRENLMPNPTTTPIDQLEQIARQYLCVGTLTARNNDNLDFHELSASNIRAALQAAYQAGQVAPSPPF